MLNLDEFRDYFGSKTDFLEFEQYVNDILNEKMDEFDYIAIKKESWYQFVLNILRKKVKKNKKLNGNTLSLEDIFNRGVKNLIIKELNQDDVRIFNNLFIKLTKTLKSREVLKRFQRELKLLNIPFDKHLFELLKEKSPKFISLLKSVGIENMDYSNFISYLNGNYDFYLHLKPFSRDLLWTKETVDSLLKFYSEASRVVIRKDKTSKEFIKFQCIMIKYDTFIEIYELFTKEYGDISLDIYFQLLIQYYSLKDIDDLLLEYSNYVTFNDEKYLSFLGKFRGRLRAYFPKEYEKQVKKEPEKERKKKYADIYEYAIRDSKEFNDPTCRSIVDELFTEFSSSDQQIIQSFFTDRKALDKKERTLAANRLASMKKHYEEIRKFGKKKVGGFQRKFVNIYEYVIRDPKELNDPACKKVVDELFAKLSLEKQQLIHDYFEENKERSSKQNKQAENQLFLLKERYEYFMKNKEFMVVGKKREYSDIYEYVIRDKEKLNDPKYREIVSGLYSKLPLEEQQLISDFFVGKLKCRTSNYFLATNRLVSMKKGFEKLISGGELNKKTSQRKYKNLYEYVIQDESEAKEVQMIILVDELFNSLATEIQQVIMNFFKGEYKSISKEYILARNHLVALRKQFKKRVEKDHFDIIQDNLSYLKQLFDNFGIPISLEIKEEKVNYYVSMLKMFELKARSCLGYSKEEYYELLKQSILDIFVLMQEDLFNKLFDVMNEKMKTDSLVRKS